MTPAIVGGRPWRALVLAAVWGLALPHVALAHAGLQRAAPADGEVVSRPVTTVTGRYSEALAEGSRLVIKDATGTTVGTGGIDRDDSRRMIARIAPALSGGRFTAESTARSADGHVERRSWQFTVLVSPTKALPTPSPSASSASSPSSASRPPAPELAQGLAGGSSAGDGSAGTGTHQPVATRRG